MTRISLLSVAHARVEQHLNPGDVAIDATLGNGHDTLFLAQQVGDSGRVFGFDIQTQALKNTLKRLQGHGLEGRVTLFQVSHGEMLVHVPQNLHGGIKAVMFNLGYLPGADKSVITETTTTLTALDAACSLLAENGMITVLAYPGHAGGDQEAERLAEWCQFLDDRCFETEIILSHHDQAHAPRLFVIRKKVDLL